MVESEVKARFRKDPGLLCCGPLPGELSGAFELNYSVVSDSLPGDWYTRMAIATCDSHLDQRYEALRIELEPE